MEESSLASVTICFGLLDNMSSANCLLANCDLMAVVLLHSRETTTTVTAASVSCRLWTSRAHCCHGATRARDWIGSESHSSALL